VDVVLRSPHTRGENRRRTAKDPKNKGEGERDTHGVVKLWRHQYLRDGENNLLHRGGDRGKGVKGGRNKGGLRMKEGSRR